ncbi:MAG: tetratricopeptide repeat protein, partial [Terracidiphilus sp.]
HEEQKGSVFYAESWALTHYLQVTDREKKTNAINDYLVLMSQHADPVAAAEKAFGNLDQLQSALQSYIQASRYKQFMLNSAAAPLDQSSYSFKTISQVEADVARAGVLANVQREKEARELLASILKSDPNNAPALETLGFLEFRSGNQEAALKWFREAVKHDSQNYLANYYFGAISMNSAQANQDSLVESSLHAAIKLNLKFAPAYDLLAALYGMRNKDLDEALSLSNRAIELDPSSLQYRLNAVNVLSAMKRYSEAVTMLQSASNVARKPEDLTMIRSLIAQLSEFEQEQARTMAAEKLAQESGTTELPVTPPEDVPKHPTEANGPKHIVIGVIRHVTCSYPSALEFRLEGPRKTISVYSNDFSKIALSAVGITPRGSMNPCKDFEGMKARIQYAETSDKTIDGQVSSIELRK